MIVIFSCFHPSFATNSLPRPCCTNLETSEVVGIVHIFAIAAVSARIKPGLSHKC